MNTPRGLTEIDPTARLAAISPTIAGSGVALPKHYYEQDALADELEKLWSKQHHNTKRLRRMFDAVQVGGRYLALPLERYHNLKDFGDSNDAFIQIGTDLAEKALVSACESAGIDPQELDALFFTTVTGIATPSIDARLVNRLSLKSSIRRTPLFGLGCVGGAAGAARMADYLRAYPTHKAALVSVELCSLTLQREDLSVVNFIASGLFGDGAAALVACGAQAGDFEGPRMVDNRAVFYPDTEWVMGWDVRSTGFKVVLSAKLPDIVRENLRPDVDAFLADHQLVRADIDTWVCHPGGPAVLNAMQDALELDDDALAVTWKSLREIGNLSSASVLWVYHQTPAPPRGHHGLLMAMGPGFCAEHVLLQW